LNAQFEEVDAEESSEPIDWKINGKTKQLSKEQVAKLCEKSISWYRRLAHSSHPCIFKNSKVAIGMDPVEDCCVIYALAKFTQKKFDETRERATRVRQIIHADLIGPITPMSFPTKEKYVQIVIDDYSRYMQTFTLISKARTVDIMDKALRAIQARFPGPGQFEKVRCDSGG